MTPLDRCRFYAEQDQADTLRGEPVVFASDELADAVALELAGLGIESA